VKRLSALSLFHSKGAVQPKDPDFPEFIQDAATGEPKAFEDTPFNRPWHAVAKHFDDIPKRISFQYRVLNLMPMITKDRKYAKYLVNRKPHIALLAAIASVPFSLRTTPRRCGRHSIESFDSGWCRQWTSTRAPTTLLASKFAAM
jgi:hypothetical protein